MFATDSFQPSLRWPKMHELMNFKKDLLELPVRTIMSTGVISVPPNTLLSKVVTLIKENNIHHIPVLDEDGACVGILSSSDILQLQDRRTRLINFDCEEINKEIAEWLLAENVMTPNPVTVEADEKLEKVVDIFLENEHRSVVVRDAGVCVGIVTPLDFIKYLYEDHWLR